MSTSERSTENAVNNGLNHDAAERLHYWLHQIVASDEPNTVVLLADALRDSLSDELVQQVIEYLSAETVLKLAADFNDAPIQDRR
ncbi:hypothetical protein [Roseiconus lacunae]|uniref:hypothetical protein n=1 Tax=Roseiconus lacunae TaxID=2605694 RepID=UPI001E5CF23E|nr:hypothetical protein [Roseiconus lacunae]MCD0459216.1 hypothetical protein [Roseiconus lacunae]